MLRRGIPVSKHLSVMITKLEEQRQCSKDRRTEFVNKCGIEQNNNKLRRSVLPIWMIKCVKLCEKCYEACVILWFYAK